MGEILDNDEDFGGMRVGRFTNDSLFRSAGVIGEGGVVPIRRLDNDVVND